MEECEYERQRRERIARNKEALSDLGIRVLTEGFAKEARSKTEARRARMARRREAARLERSHEPTRRSERLLGITPHTLVNDYPPDIQERIVARKQLRSRARSTGAERRRDIYRDVGDYGRVEHYTEKHVRALGTCKTVYPWEELLVPKVYDACGTTCHQCRQKTRDRKTECTTCKAIPGQLCGMCLQLRYGENLQEVLDTLDAGGQWECPVCRGICNCSICRSRKGWPPTGILAPYVKDYPSVAHYLVHTHLVKDGAAEATEEEQSEAEDDDVTAPQASASSQGEEVSASPIAHAATAAELDDSTRMSLDRVEDSKPADLSTSVVEESSAASEAGSPAPDRVEDSLEAPQEGSEEDEGEGEIFEVEAIVDTRKYRGARQYLVRWRGYGPASDTWEPEQNCSGCPDIVAAFWRSHPTRSSPPAKKSRKY
eukprot:m51a1_g13904 hypothetical protein (429) ;mRNA; r:755636-757275